MGKVSTHSQTKVGLHREFTAGIQKAGDFLSDFFHEVVCAKREKGD